MNDAVAFCRRRLVIATDHCGELEQATSTLRTNDEQAESSWVGEAAAEIRRRDLGPYHLASSNQLTTLLQAIDEAQALLSALAETACHERDATASLSSARANAQSATDRIQAARASTQGALASVAKSEDSVAAALSLLVDI